MVLTVIPLAMLALLQSGQGLAVPAEHRATIDRASRSDSADFRRELQLRKPTGTPTGKPAGCTKESERSAEGSGAPKTNRGHDDTDKDHNDGDCD